MNNCESCIMKTNRIKQIETGLDMFQEMQGKIQQIIGCFGKRMYTCDQQLPLKVKDYIDEMCSRQGDKAKLKKRIKELEKENEVLKGLIK